MMLSVRMGLPVPVVHRSRYYPVGNPDRFNPMDSLAQKLNPSRFPGMSPMMAPVVGFVLGESFTDPAIAEIVVSEQENIAYIRKVGGVGVRWSPEPRRPAPELEPPTRRRWPDT